MRSLLSVEKHVEIAITRKLVKIKKDSLRRYNSKKSSKGSRNIVINVLFFVVVLVAGSFIYVSGIEKRLQKDIKSENLKPIKNEPFNLLILGKDTEDFKTPGRSDTIIVAHFDPKKKDVLLVSVPRDTKVNINNKTSKINAAYPIGGPQLAKSEVEKLLDIEIARYYVINWQGFEKIVDLLGGIWIDVEKPMYYKAKNADIDLKPGRQLLDGKKALGYARFRNDRHGDLGRITRQQKFMFALVEQSKEIKNLVKLPSLIDGIVDNAMTNSTTSEVLWLLKTFREIEKSDLQAVMIPGEARMINGVSYFVADEDQLPNISAQMGWRTKNDFESGKLPVVADVYNASNVDGLARGISNFLKEAGFSIGKVDTSPKLYLDTTIFHKKESKEKAKLVAYFLSQKISNPQIELIESTDSKTELSVYIGKRDAHSLASLNEDSSSMNPN